MGNDGSHGSTLDGSTLELQPADVDATIRHQEGGLLVSAEHAWVIHALVPIDDEEAEAIVDGRDASDNDGYEPEVVELDEFLQSISFDREGAFCRLCRRRRVDVLREGLTCVEGVISLGEANTT